MPSFSSNFANKHVLVTGGSKGIGRSIVETFLAEGANVSFCARTIRGDEFSLFKGATNGARAVGSAVDISNPEEIKSWVAGAAKEFGRIDSVIANASPLIGDATPEAWENSFRADILGLVTLIDASTPFLEERHGTPLLALLIRPLRGLKPYWLKIMPANLALWACESAPGSIENPNITLPDGTVQLSQYQIVKRDNYPFYKSLLDAVPLARTGAPEEVANTVIFLASGLASYINGANIVVDGGMSLFF
ncbi:hypothetical protein Trihar35433_9407 [Trichoderma harzianum]|nr:hypothetical protein Trihar35433_9407 [Trichoderma harzianum]